MAKAESKTLTIAAPKLETAEFVIIGTAPYVMAKFSNKAKQAMRSKHEAGSTAKKGKTREARDFDQDYLESQHVSTDGWLGFHAGGLRQAFISACRLVNFKMTLAKLSVFTLADGFDRDEGTPLVRLYGTPEKVEHMVRNATGVADIRVRSMFRQWYSKVRVRYDTDQFTAQDVANLLMRVGEQVGIGEGRPDSKQSAGMGWGTFRIADAEEVESLKF